MLNPIRFDTPVIAPEMHVDAGSVDPDDDISSSAYADLFDRIASVGLDILNCGEAYRAASGHAMLTTQSHVSFLRPLQNGARVRGTFRLVDASASRLHVYLEIYHVDGWLAAAEEAVYAHVECASRTVSEFPAPLAADVAVMLRYHRSLPRPKFMGRALAMA